MGEKWRGKESREEMQYGYLIEEKQRAVTAIVMGRCRRRERMSLQLSMVVGGCTVPALHPTYGMVQYSTVRSGTWDGWLVGWLVCWSVAWRKVDEDGEFQC